MKKNYIIMLLCAVTMTAVQAATKTVSPGSNTLSEAIVQAAEGDVLELQDGTYNESNTLKPTVALSIRAAAGAKPVVVMSGRIEAKTDISIEGITMQTTASSECIRLVPGTKAYDVALRSCTLSGFTSRFLRVYNTDQTAPYVNSISIDDCVLRMPSGARGIEASKAELQVNSLSVSNSTFDGGSAGTGRMMYIQTTEGVTIQSCTIDHCTFYNSTDRRAVYLANINGAKVSNSIIMNRVSNDDNKGFCLYGANSAISNCISHNTSVYGSGYSTTKVSIRNPLFVGADSGDFRLYANSPAVGAATDGSNIGDKRWEVMPEEYYDPNQPYIPYKKPYSMAPTTTTVKVLWQMTEESKPTEAVVHYGKSRHNLDKQLKTDAGWNVDGEGYIHIVTLTGLEPNTRYYFTVGDSVRRYTDTCSTKTAPLAGTAYRIFSISDIHGNSCKNWENMQDFICGLDPDIALMNGDFVSSKGNDRNWNGYYFTPGAKFLAQVPVISSPGNHETGDPRGYRWSSFYDYFHQFSHGTPEDSVTDPRGESYFHFEYGNADVLIVNLNGDESSPEFLPGSKQYKWADSTLNACTKPWIIVCHHVGMWTSGYHGQWSEEPKQFSTVLEKYAKQGKRIIALSGDDHSFEHLYKDGVHYVRPGCGRNSNYPQQKQLKDFRYSMFYRQISCFSTFDMAADASTIDLTAYDSVGNKFYTYQFVHDNEVIKPSVTFTYTATSTEDSVQLQWCAFDPAGDGRVSLYYAQNDKLTDTKSMTLIADGFDSDTYKYMWHTRDIMPKGTYYIYAVITSGGKSYMSNTPFAIELMNDTTPPPAPTGMSGYAEDGHYRVVWRNPTHLVHIANKLQDFSSGIEGIETEEEDGGKMTVRHDDGALRADYNISAEWKTAAANYVFAEPADARQTPVLTFRLKGDGSGIPLRLVCKNISSGHEDWWYTESHTLSSTEWQEIKIDMRNLQSFSWYANSDEKNHAEAVVCISFAISYGSAVAGSFWIDDIEFSGDIYPAPDFKETVVLRKDDGFAASPADGKEVYRGRDEGFTDTDADASRVYYYAAFAADDRGNFSAAARSAQWCTTEPFTGTEKISTERRAARKTATAQGIAIVLPDGRRYSATGQLTKQ